MIKLFFAEHRMKHTNHYDLVPYVRDNFFCDRRFGASRGRLQLCVQLQPGQNCVQSGIVKYRPVRTVNVTIQRQRHT